MIIAFDFDETLANYVNDGKKIHCVPNHKIVQLLNTLLERGDKIYIVTARCRRTSRPALQNKAIRCKHPHSLIQNTFFDLIRKKEIITLEDFLDLYVPLNDKLAGIYYTDGQAKGELLDSLKASVLIDDSRAQRESADDYGILAIHPDDFSGKELRYLFGIEKKK